jgi:hypothetical protein
LGKKIAILFHQRNTRANIRSYSIVLSAKLWRQQGHDIEFLFGTGRFVPADMCIVHIDLTKLPEKYTRFSQQYPVVINGTVADISKSSISNHLLQPGDGYRGKVIVKTDSNYAGWPEKRLTKSLPYRVFDRVRNRLINSPYVFCTSYDYRIYDDLGVVPSRYFEDPTFVVEKFLPEIEGDYYISCSCLFMGDSSRCYRRGSRNPIVKNRGIEFEQVVDPHPEVFRIRKKMNLEIGKIDYCIHSGEFVLHDINKTFTSGDSELKESLEYYFHQTNALQSLFSRSADKNPGSQSIW